MRWSGPRRQEGDQAYHRRHPWRTALLVGVAGSLLAAVPGAILVAAITGESKTESSQPFRSIAPIGDLLFRSVSDGPHDFEIAPLMQRPWVRSLQVQPNTVLAGVVTFSNRDTEFWSDVTVRLEFPDNVRIVPRSILLYNSADDGTEQDEDNASLLFKGGINFGDYLPVNEGEDSFFLKFRILVEGAKGGCGQAFPLSLLSFVRSTQHPMEIRSQVTVVLIEPCP